MSANHSVEVADVSKRYRLGERATSLREAIMGLSRRRSPSEVWALRNVSLTVPEGRALGVVGRNGAGKSTLLKVVARITEPTSGTSWTRGRVASLLEVGTGFHHELTGRENIYLGGAVMGLGRRAIAQRFDEIVAFAGVEQFLDTPVKRYSSGMHLRLAFAVAAHLEPEILVVDEVLAVGDAEFQRRCLGRMRLAEQDGRTVLFCSHDLDALQRLCDRAVWLDRGEVRADGPSAEVIDAYLRSTLTSTRGEGEVTVRSGPLRDLSVRTVDAAGVPLDVIRRERGFTVEVAFTLEQAVPDLDLAVYLINDRGVRVLDDAWSDSDQERRTPAGAYRARLRIPPVFNVGGYTVGVWAGTSSGDEYVDEPSACHLTLEGTLVDRAERVTWLDLPWDVAPAEVRRP